MRIAIAHSSEHLLVADDCERKFIVLLAVVSAFDSVCLTSLRNSNLTLKEVSMHRGMNTRLPVTSVSHHTF
jgi:hypothetical protein